MMVIDFKWTTSSRLQSFLGSLLAHKVVVRVHRSKDPSGTKMLRQNPQYRTYES